ncbi:MAG: ABC-2 transporter permease [Oscillospiraceae bacterium]|nr:ABC-2 transporter permease [Oscillospiraceae bacterium]
MNRILNAAKLDFYAGKSMLAMVAALTVIAVIIGLVAHGPAYAMIFMMIFGVTLAGSIFNVNEKSRSDRLYGVLPLKKTEMIAGRYLYALIIGAVYIVAASILGAVMWKVMGSNADLNLLGYWAAAGVGFTYYCFAVGVAYPLYFKFTFAKAYVFTMIPMYLIAVLFLILTKKGNLASTLAQIVKFFTAHIYLAPIFGILGGLILITVSALIANLIYTRKEI